MAGFGPTDQQRLAWTPRGWTTPLEAIGNVRGRSQNPSRPKGVIYGSPILLGSDELYYEPDLFYYSQRSAYPVVKGKPGAPIPYPYGISDYFQPTAGINGEHQLGYGEGKQRDYLVRNRTFAGQIKRNNYPRDPILGGDARLSIGQISNAVTNHLVDTVNNSGPFSALIPGAPNGFLVSESHDMDVEWDGQSVSREFGTTFNTIHYRPAAMEDSDPLDDVLDNFYGVPRSAWARDFEGLSKKNQSKGLNYSIANVNIGPGLNTTFDYSNDTAPMVAVLGPLSNHTIKLGNGNNIVAASPVMTPAFHRMYRYSREKGGDRKIFAEWSIDTILYPSSVGDYRTNNLSLGNGDNLVYYDSSFSNIEAGSGKNVFIPSFGSFNWSIDWIPGYRRGWTTTIVSSPPNYWDRNEIESYWIRRDPNQGPLISPLPWDSSTLNPKDGSPIYSNPYVTKAKNFAANPRRDDDNYYYTVSTYNEKDNNWQQTFLNGQILTDNDPVRTYNPVNRIGGVTLKANGGDNIFYGFDPQLWSDLFPKALKVKDDGTLLNDGTPLTTNNLIPDGKDSNNKKGYVRAAQHAWDTVTMLGGRGNNTFYLGNVIDDITNNGAFYEGDQSYRLSLTHDKIYQKGDIERAGAAFANATDPSRGTPLSSVVNLTIKSEPYIQTVIAQQATKGKGGNPLRADQEAAAWGGLANATNKLVQNADKIQQDYVTGWTATNTTGMSQDFIKKAKEMDEAKKWIKLSTTFARTIGTFVPFFDLAISVVSAVSGLINLFVSKESTPPQKEITASYIIEGLDKGKKAVVINDWHPGAKVNIMLPALSSNAWKSLTLTVQDPTNASTINTDDGAYLMLAIANSDTGSRDEFPLVVLENVGKPNLSFGYKGYDFKKAKGNSTASSTDFTTLSGSNFALFGTLPAPKTLKDANGQTVPRDRQNFFVTDGSDNPFVYKSSDGFDMRYDSANYMSFFGPEADNTAGYLKYYFTLSDPQNKPKGVWSVDGNLRAWTSNVSLEFDTRSLGYYWQPVLDIKSKPTDDDLNALASDAESINLDTNKSSLWINTADQGWKAFSYSSFAYDLKAYRYSLLAETFYSSADKGDEIMNKKIAVDNMLKRFEEFVPNLLDLDQSQIANARQRLLLPQQIKDVQTSSQRAEGKTREGLLVQFFTENEQGQSVDAAIFVYKNNAGVATAITTNLVKGTAQALQATNDQSFTPTASSLMLSDTATLNSVSNYGLQDSNSSTPWLDPWQQNNGPLSVPSVDQQLVGIG